MTEADQNTDKSRRRISWPLWIALALLGLIFLTSIALLASELSVSMPHNTLTYAYGELKWSADTATNNHGVSTLNLFRSKYGDVAESDNGDKIVAPGLSGSDSFYLSNGENHDLEYEAVLFFVDQGDLQQIRKWFEAPGATIMDPEDTNLYMLPEGVTTDNVFGVVRGSLQPYGEQQFVISWDWPSNFTEETVPEDLVETQLGDDAADSEAENVHSCKMGLFIAIDDPYAEDGWTLPQTGDNNLSLVAGVTTIMSLVLLILLILAAVDRRKKEKQGENDE